MHVCAPAISSNSFYYYYTDERTRGIYTTHTIMPPLSISDASDNAADINDNGSGSSDITITPAASDVIDSKATDSSSSIVIENKDEKVGTRTKPTTKTVRFCADERRVREIPALSMAEKCQAWLSKNDMAQIRKDCIKTVQRVMNRSLAAQYAHEPLELRGLEAKLPYGVWRRQQSRKAATETVLKEQSYQKKRQFSDQEWISALYQRATHRSEMEARAMGKRDELAAVSSVGDEDKENAPVSLMPKVPTRIEI
mmetsp:Transcript_21073/g.60127  ORF Transcript_21073/g.60127 Transcript_21073/m.60127 type:complete len:254 (-) Transcript_21073:246-1007(-)